jgi:wyosine [tRNA(Phe)-imidazoG37] synthetase (radical SAM superfamily)
LEEVVETLSLMDPEDVDWITFVGSGEPLLHSNIGRLIRGVKETTDIPVAVITNGSLLSEPAVSEDLLVADAVLPTLDAGTEELFRRINRPHPSISFRRQVNGLTEFRRHYEGQFLLELMLLKGLNDSREALQRLSELVAKIQPDEVHISLPERPPAEPWVEPADVDGVRRASEILGQVSKVLHPGEGILTLTNRTDAMEGILAVIGRHPLSEAQLLRALGGLFPPEQEEVLEELENSGRAKRIQRYGCWFWVSGSARFPDCQSASTRKPKWE